MINSTNDYLTNPIDEIVIDLSPYTRIIDKLTQYTNPPPQGLYLPRSMHPVVLPKSVRNHYYIKRVNLDNNKFSDVVYPYSSLEDMLIPSRMIETDGGEIISHAGLNVQRSLTPYLPVMELMVFTDIIVSYLTTLLANNSGVVYIDNALPTRVDDLYNNAGLWAKESFELEDLLIYTDIRSRINKRVKGSRLNHSYNIRLHGYILIIEILADMRVYKYLEMVEQQRDS